MTNGEFNTANTTGGTIGGTILVILSSLPLHDMGKTTLLAVVGAITSFCVSVTLQYLFKKKRPKE